MMTNSLLIFRYSPATRGQNPGHVHIHCTTSLVNPSVIHSMKVSAINTRWHQVSIQNPQLSNEKRAPGCLGCIGGYTTLCYNAIIGIFMAFHYTDCFFLEPMAYSLVFQVPCEDRCERTPKHLLRQGLWGVQTLPHQVFGGFWKTRDHNLYKTEQ